MIPNQVGNDDHLFNIFEILILKFCFKYFFQFFYFGLDNQPAIRLTSVFIKIVLVVIFGNVKRLGSLNGCYYFFAKSIGFIQFGFILLGCGFLLCIVVKNNRTVLRSAVGTLAVKRGRIVAFPEYFQQFIKSWLIGEAGLNKFPIPN